jgi:hypothetical protein
MIRYSSRRFSPAPVGTGNWSTPSDSYRCVIQERDSSCLIINPKAQALFSCRRFVSSRRAPPRSSVLSWASGAGKLELRFRELQRLPRGCGLFIAPNLERTSAADCIAHRCTILGEHRKARSRPLESKICPKEPARGFAESIFAQLLPAAQYSPLGSTSFVTGVHCRDHADYPALAVAE